MKSGFSFLLNINTKNELSPLKFPLYRTFTSRVSRGFIFVENMGIALQI